jgi:alpha-methylacyl-CoA racemase
MAGPLRGYRIIEVAGIGPGPFCGMMLADMGADVIRVDRSAAVREDADLDRPPNDLLGRGRRSIALDLKQSEGVEALLTLVESADALIEGFRPGVMERLGIGPDVCMARNPRLVFGRMTGWGQDGPYAQAAGHDINYISLAGALAHIGRADGAPVPPLNLIGDFGGGGMLLAYGVVCALLEVQRSGVGQVIDAAMVDGAAVLMTMFWGMRNSPLFDENQRGHGMLDTAAPFYDAYRCADGEYISVGSIEPQFYAELLRLTGLKDDPEFRAQMDTAKWPTLKERITAVFATKTSAEWCALMEHTDVCFAPVLRVADAATHPHNVARATFVKVAGVEQPAPAPRFSRTSAAIERPPAHPGQHTREVLDSLGLDAADVEKLLETGAAKQA